MTLRSLQKWHGAGNDFLIDVVDEPSVPWWNAPRARAVCHRAFGVGADGLLVASMGERVSMVLYNADGSIAEMSGNGIRCLAAAVRRRTNGAWDDLLVETDAGSRSVSLRMQSDDAGFGSVSMGTVAILDPLAGALGVANVGNPHVVVLDDSKWSVSKCEEIAAGFTGKVGDANVEFVTMIDETRVRIRVLERGVGWTLACGTGSVATAAICHREGLTGNEVTVENPGGDLMVKIAADGASLAGPVQFVADVEWLEA
jgi:diaminopimelate epimerase